MMDPIVLWIVEDDSGFRRTLNHIINEDEELTCSRVFPSCVPLFVALETDEAPDLILMDLGLPGMDGVEGIRQLVTTVPDVAILVLTVFREKEKVMEALDAGASGYLIKTSTGDEILQGIRQVFQGRSVLSPEVAKIVLDVIQKPFRVDQFHLTKREIEVLEALSLDLSVQEIADKLGVSRRTAAFHLENIYCKLEVKSQSGAVAKALRSGLI